MVRRRTPPLNALRAFEASARHGSFAAAAAELSVTAAAISHRIKELERNLGIALFTRRPRGVRLTDAGRRYRDQVAAALQLIERATAELETGSVDGPLTVSTAQSFAEHWLIPRLPSLIARFPGLQLTIAGSSRLLDFRDDQADLAIRFGAGHYPDLDVTGLCGDAVTILAPEAALAGRSDTRAKTLLGDAILLTDTDVAAAEAWHGWPPWLREAGVARGGTREISFADGSLALAACRNGGGFCIGRMSSAFDCVKRRELRPLVPWKNTVYAHYAVTRKAERDNPRIAAFRAWLGEETAKYRREVRAALDVELDAPAAAA